MIEAVPEDSARSQIGLRALSIVPPAVMLVTSRSALGHATSPFASELEAVKDAVSSRRTDYLAVRSCARMALAELGVPPTEILNDEDRVPLWPEGIVGSLSHCPGYQVAAVAPSNRVCALGIDVEPNLALPAEVLRLVADEDEIAQLQGAKKARTAIAWDRLLFSAKESVFKAWFPRTREWLEFQDCHLTFDAQASNLTEGGRFEAEIRVRHEGPAGETSGKMTGRWCLDGSVLLTAVCIRT